jgi:transcriptional regulator with XRE-family HTH domain
LNSALASKVRSISQLLLLSQEDVGSIVGTSARTVARWSSGASEPQRTARDRLSELVFIGEQVSRVLKPEAANWWIFAPNELLGADTPAERIRAGDFRSVLALIEALADGVVV